MIHLFYGDGAKDAFTCFNKGGRHLVFREALLAGPAALPSPSWMEDRARFLSESFGGTYEKCLADLKSFDDQLLGLDDDDELVLWFGRDLFCQIALIYILVRLGEVRTANISLVCPPDTNEEVYCFGDMPPAELNDYLQTRVRIEPLDFQHAAIAWHLYCSDDPEALNTALDGSLEVGPRFAAALEAHAARFPSTRDNLGETERAILISLARGPLAFSELFQSVSNRTRHITWGDCQVRNLCERLAASEPPLLHIEARDEEPLGLTEAGTLALTERCDALDRPAHWLGGCEQFGATSWAWDAHARRIVYSGT